LPQFSQRIDRGFGLPAHNANGIDSCVPDCPCTIRVAIVLFPISDDNRGITGPALVTYSLLAVNIIVFIYQANHPEFTYAYSVIPEEITSGVDLTEPVAVKMRGQLVEIPQAPGPPIIYLTLLTHMFMHGGFAHLIGNMLYLWIFGDNVEHRFGHVKFLMFYLISGLVAAFAQIAARPDGVIPSLGASGAIYGVLGAYLVLFPRNKVNVVVFYYIVTVPAIYVIGLWAVTQFFFSYGSLFVTEQTGGVAYLAHVGGFVAGIIMGLIARSRMRAEPDSTNYRQYREDPTVRQWW
jgi:membrane associated rhomboid family serine protease